MRGSLLNGLEERNGHLLAPELRRLVIESRAQNMLRMPVPQPTSRTDLPRKRCGLLTMAARYEPVRTVSFSISSWMPVRPVYQQVEAIFQGKQQHTPKCAYESA